MSFTKSAIRRIGFLSGSEREYRADKLESDQDDLSCTVSIFCNFLITIITPYYYKTFWRQKKAGAFKQNQRILNQIAFISINPSLFCILNTITFILECAVSFEFEPAVKYTNVQKILIVIVNLGKVLCVLMIKFNSQIFKYYLLFFGSLINCFIILLAIQRFILIFLPQKLHCSVKPCALRFYIIFIWIAAFIYRMLVLILFYAYMRGEKNKHIENFHNRMSYWGFGLFAFVTLIYLAIFINLYKIPRDNKWKRPEVALLYEGIPLLLTNMFILYYVRYSKEEGGLTEYYYNYEMRRIMITTALVQFTFVFTFEKILKFFSTDLKVIANRSSIFRPLVATRVHVQELNHI